MCVCKTSSSDVCFGQQIDTWMMWRRKRWCQLLSNPHHTHSSWLTPNKCKCFINDRCCNRIQSVFYWRSPEKKRVTGRIVRTNNATCWFLLSSLAANRGILIMCKIFKLCIRYQMSGKGIRRFYSKFVKYTNNRPVKTSESFLARAQNQND